MRYIISKKATEDLELIWQYTYFQWSERQADKYYNFLIETIIRILHQKMDIPNRLKD